MAKIRIESLDLSYNAEKGESILDANLEQDVDHPHDCGGNCACSTCKIIVVSGGEHLSPQDEDEFDTLDAYGWEPGDYRLACQCLIQEDGEIVIRLPEPE
ncbi:MAG: 2Fe-2S iron-sulfur cluster-binding protein [bacterium]|nr:2Fe-2S iron-sulfur cluster-binding protein [bacterium]